VHSFLGLGLELEKDGIILSSNDNTQADIDRLKIRNKN
jgi:hypothetical protein